VWPVSFLFSLLRDAGRCMAAHRVWRLGRGGLMLSLLVTHDREGRLGALRADAAMARAWKIAEAMGLEFR
jgi:hypothetical protein